MKFSLSTSWNSARHSSGAGIIDEVKAAGFDTVELNFALTESIVNEILSLKQASGISVSSLHNICPLPKEVEPDEASPDYYSLAAFDEAERRLAVEAARNTISYAGKFGAKAVILHCGRVQIKDRTRDLAALVDDKQGFAELKEAMISQRAEKKDGYLDNVIRSLGELIPFAKEAPVALTVENRYYYREIPIAEELDAIFRSFEPGDIHYWHDVGHAEVFERLGLARHREMLDKFQDRLIGVHLHDIIGPIGDHRAPGEGTFDFRMIKPYLKEDTVKVIEAHQPATAAQIRNAVKYLEKVLS